ncbi:uncharacterized protein B0H18DRAFT_1112192 [Fomitopsis serialis]|uniref:uncharacterized protein n=1 Tax=Fomitopsis serialis TaxID=139415 RepID=UPI0020087B69|nr:uncharacterized protein B0H18DRAFT_1112192 [Neoantrodia serialis]KAH9937996.1 hypothetical protein B0H18DRAFT_1112192 [Neoantrodia serialis]
MASVAAPGPLAACAPIRITPPLTGADEQNDDVLGDDELTACGQIADEQSDEEFGDEEISDDEQSSRKWRSARFQGTLPLALSARVPLEVFELVMDAIEHQPTLVAVALVCAAWYPRAMRNLYYNLEIRGRKTFNMLFKQCRASPRVKQWLAGTCKLVVDESKWGMMASTQRRKKNKNDNRFLHALPSGLASLMPRVQTLHIRYGSLRFIRTDFFLALSKFESVKSLTLGFCQLNNISQLRRIVSAFPQLTDLTMDNVAFTQQGSVGDAGASLFQPPSHTRLRHLAVNVDNELMATFLDWMTRSGFCASLADLEILFNDRPISRTLPSKLLEVAGASLTRYCEGYRGNGHDRRHGNLLQNTALRSLQFQLIISRHKAEDQGRRAVWIKAADELHGIFSTIRSRQLEHIEVHVDVRLDGSTLGSGQSSDVHEKLDLRDLHKVMSQPYFDALKDVEVKMNVFGIRTPQANSNVDEFRDILQPWSARGIVTFGRY